MPLALEDVGVTVGVHSVEVLEAYCNRETFVWSLKSVHVLGVAEE